MRKFLVFQLLFAGSIFAQVTVLPGGTGGGGGGGTANLVLPSTANNIPLVVDTLGSLNTSNLSQDPITGAITPLLALFSQTITVSENAGAPNIDLSTGNDFILTVTQADTITISNGATVNGAQPKFTWRICQDGTGGFAVTFPSGFSAAAPVDTTANICTVQSFKWDGTNAIPNAPAWTSQAGTFLFGPIRAAPSGSPASGNMFGWFDTTGLNFQTKNSSGAKSGTIFTIANVAHKWLNSCDATTGVCTATTPTSSDLASLLLCSDSSGSGTVQSCSTTPTFTPSTGTMIAYKTTTANTGALTLNVNSNGAAPVHKWQGTALIANDIVANSPVIAVYDGTNWNIVTVANPIDTVALKTRACATFTFDGQGSAIANNTFSPVVEVLTGMTVVGYNVYVDAGTITIDVLKATNSNGTPSFATITSSQTPAVASGTNFRSTTVNLWTSPSAHDLLQAKVTAISTAAKASLVVECTQ